MLWSILRVSFRNVSRNARRSLITALAVLIGTGFIIFARGSLNGFHAAMVAGVTETQAGDLQLHHPEYLEASQALPLDKNFAVDERFQALMSKVPEIESWSARISFSGMISNGNETTLFFGQAIDPDNEYKVCPRNKNNIEAGGQPLSMENPKGVVIGKALAESLKVKVGDELQILMNSSAGALVGMDVTVVGIAEFRIPGVGNKILHIPLQLAQQKLDMVDKVTEVVANVKSLDDVDVATAQLQQQLSGEFSDLKLTPNSWKDLDVGRFILGSIDLQNQVLFIVIFVLFLVMISGIVNTMLMSVFERVREIGTMMAIGIRRWKILVMFLFEAVTLSALGALAGVGIGAGIVRFLGSAGMPLPSIGGGTSPVIYPYIQLDYMGMVIAVAVVVAVLAALYPAVRASLMRPAEALRTL